MTKTHLFLASTLLLITIALGFLFVVAAIIKIRRRHTKGREKATRSTALTI